MWLYHRLYAFQSWKTESLTFFLETLSQGSIPLRASNEEQAFLDWAQHKETRPVSFRKATWSSQRTSFMKVTFQPQVRLCRFGIAREASSIWQHSLICCQAKTIYEFQCDILLMLGNSNCNHILFCGLSNVCQKQTRETKQSFKSIIIMVSFLRKSCY